MKLPVPILFALGTAFCWGLYGPTLSKARSPEKLWSPFKPYVGIGMAYLVWAVIGGATAMHFKGDSFSFKGVESAAGTWGFAAGTLGALGALSLTSAMLSFKGPPRAEIVMPIVFGGAVAITAIVSLFLHRGETKSSPWLWVGIIGIGIYTVLVAANTPHGPAKPKPEQSAQTDAAVENSS